MKNPVTPMTPEQAAAREVHGANEPYIERVLVGLDQSLNVDMGGNLDETISSRLARASMHGKWWGKLGSFILGKIQRNHGANAVADDVGHAEKVIGIEENSGILPK